MLVLYRNYFVNNRFDGVIHLAAESHVDRSITNPMEFIFTNIVGTVNFSMQQDISGKMNFPEKNFIIFQPMKFMVHLVKQVISLKKQLIAPQSLFCFQSKFRSPCQGLS